MILVDRRVGSRELLPLMPKGLAAEVELEFGDAMLVGNGPDGGVTVGIERKTVPDLLNSLESGRLVGHQLPGLVAAYNIVYLLIEGMYRPDVQGGLSRLVVRDGGWAQWQSASPSGKGWMYRDFVQRLLTLEARGGMRLHNTTDIHDTVAWLVALHRWWERPWDEHRSHECIYEPQAVSYKPVSTLRRVANALPGVGLDKSVAVERHFKSIRQLACADEREWQKVPGIGKKLSSNLVKELTGGR